MMMVFSGIFGSASCAAAETDEVVSALRAMASAFGAGTTIVAPATRTVGRAGIEIPHVAGVATQRSSLCHGLFSSILVDNRDMAQPGVVSSHRPAVQGTRIVSVPWGSM